MLQLSPTSVCSCLQLQGCVVGVVLSQSSLLLSWCNSLRVPHVAVQHLRYQPELTFRAPQHLHWTLLDVGQAAHFKELTCC